MNLKIAEVLFSWCIFSNFVRDAFFNSVVLRQNIYYCVWLQDKEWNWLHTFGECGRRELDSCTVVTKKHFTSLPKCWVGTLSSVPAFNHQRVAMWLNRFDLLNLSSPEVDSKIIGQKTSIIWRHQALKAKSCKYRMATCNCNHWCG